MERKCKTMARSFEKDNQNSLWFKNKKALNHVFSTMRRHSLSSKQIQTQNQKQRPPLIEIPIPKPARKVQDSTLPSSFVSDKTSLLSDEFLLKILSRLPKSQRNSNSLVCKRWLSLQGRVVRSIKLLDREFLISGRLFLRFPNIIRVDLVNGCLISPRNSGVICTHKIASFHVASDFDWFCSNTFVLNSDEVDMGLKILSSGCPNLRKLAVLNATEIGLMNMAEESPTLQELELHMCNDQVLRGIAAFQNLQILRLSGGVNGLYSSLVSDVGLTILAQGCKRLVRLELNGCKGSYEGIRAIGQCCQMLEELILGNHMMEDGWLFALSHCENLKTLRLLSCKRIDRISEYEYDEQLGSCLALETLHLDKCQLRDKKVLRVLFLVCQNVREVVLKNCWGLDDDMFSTAKAFRRVRVLSLEGCSLLTAVGLESTIISWKELQSLRVKSCNNMKDCEVKPALSSMFSSLKDLKWNPDSKSLLLANLAGTGMGKKGCKSFKKSLPGV